MAEVGHIYIYGEIIPFQDENVNQWGGVNLKEVVNQIKNNSEAEELIVHIHSPGGSVTEGYAIHDALSSSGKKIITRIEGLCASIATVIALAGEERQITPNSTFMIHNPWGMEVGDSETLKDYADKLEAEEVKLAEFYAKKTGLDVSDLREMMKVETEMSAQEAVDKGFATVVVEEIKAVAKLNIETMDKKTVESLNENVGVLAKLIEDVKGLFKSSEPKALALQDSSGIELYFEDLEQEQEPAVGAKAKVDGSPADGEYVMPDGKTFVFASGTLDKIIPSEDNELAALQEENENLKAELDESVKALDTAKKELEDVKADFQAKTEEFDKVLKETKATIKNLDIEIDKSKPEEDGEKIRRGYKTKNNK